MENEGCGEGGSAWIRKENHFIAAMVSVKTFWLTSLVNLLDVELPVFNLLWKKGYGEKYHINGLSFIAHILTEYLLK